MTREEAKSWIIDHWGNDLEDGTKQSEVVKICLSALSENKGEWIAQDIHNCHTNFKCSECGYIHSFMHLYGEPTADYPYCPNCGARMKGSE